MQDSFVAMHGKWRAAADPDQALGYLRQTVVNRARSAQRHHKVADKHLPRHDRRRPASAEQHAHERRDARGRDGALHQLPTRQREVLVLRYYSDLSEADIADALGISRGAVKSHASRGINALRTTLEEHMNTDDPRDAETAGESC